MMAGPVSGRLSTPRIEGEKYLEYRANREIWARTKSASSPEVAAAVSRVIRRASRSRRLGAWFPPPPFLVIHFFVPHPRPGE